MLSQLHLILMKSSIHLVTRLNELKPDHSKINHSLFEDTVLRKHAKARIAVSVDSNKCSEAIIRASLENVCSSDG